MENETEGVVELPVDEEVLETEESDTTDWKAEALKAQAIAKRYKTKLEKSKDGKTVEQKPDKPSESSPKSESKGELDYGQKAYLKSYGIAGSDELSLVREYVANTGKSLDELVDNKYFNNALTELREARASKDAVPSNTRRAVNSPKDSVDYWLSKPFAEVPAELKTQVVNARIKREKDNSMFSSTPIVMG